MTDAMSAVAGEFTKSGRRPAIWIVGACWTAQIVLFAYLVPFLIIQTAQSTSTAAIRQPLIEKLLPGNVDLTTAAAFPIFGGAIMLILGVLLVGAEYRWGTWSTILTQGPSRLAILLGKSVSSALIVAIIVVISYLAAMLVSIALAIATHRTLQAPPIGRLALSLMVAILISYAWLSLGMFLGIVFRSSTAALAVGLIYGLALENLISSVSSVTQVLSPLRKLLLGVNSGSLVAVLGAATQSAPDGTPGVVSVVGGSQATATLLIYVLGTFGLCLFLLQRRDVA
jgi:ABC-type transport system involved in multi-copper enzyme maturation permease subunit